MEQRGSVSCNVKFKLDKLVSLRWFGGDVTQRENSQRDRGWDAEEEERLEE